MGLRSSLVLLIVALSSGFLFLAANGPLGQRITTTTETKTETVRSQPQINITAVNGGIRIDGAGFMPDSEVSITFDGARMDNLGIIHTDPHGVFTVTLVHVPAGLHLITAIDSAGNSVAEWFKLPG